MIHKNKASNSISKRCLLMAHISVNSSPEDNSSLNTSIAISIKKECTHLKSKVAEINTFNNPSISPPAEATNNQNSPYNNIQKTITSTHNSKPYKSSTKKPTTTSSHP